VNNFFKLEPILMIFGTLQGGPKNGYQFYFWNNFGNSAPSFLHCLKKGCIILTIIVTSLCHLW